MKKVLNRLEPFSKAILIVFSIGWLTILGNACQTLYSNHHDNVEKPSLSSCNKPYDNARINLAKDFFYYEWKKRFGDKEGKIANNLINICIEFSNTKWSVNGYQVDGTPGAGKAIGQTFYPDYVKVYSPSQSYQLYKTSLVHELIHASLWIQNNDPDADHLGDKYPGWTQEHMELLEEVNILYELIEL